MRMLLMWKANFTIDFDYIQSNFRIMDSLSSKVIKTVQNDIETIAYRNNMPLDSAELVVIYKRDNLYSSLLQ